MRRFYAAPAGWDETTIQLSAAVVHHLQVLRIEPGDEAVFWDGGGRCARGRVAELDRRGGRVSILEQWREPDTAHPIHLLQGLPKSDKYEWVLQKTTELGLARITPFLSRRSVPQPKQGRSEKRCQRWQRIAEEAARQSGRCTLPRLDEPLVLDAALAECTSELRLMLWEDGSQPMQEVLPASPPASTCVLVGPEGGFDATEVALAQRHGFQPVRIGPRILRTETAAVAILSILQYVYGDLGAGAELPATVREISASQKEWT